MALFDRCLSPRISSESCFACREQPNAERRGNMKILLVHNSYQHHGGEDVVFRQEKELLEAAGHEVFTYEKSNQAALEEAHHSRLLLGVHSIWAISSRKEFRDILQQLRPDIVHVHNTF